MTDETDRIVATARELVQLQDESFADWLDRVCTRLGIGGSEFDVVLAAARQVRAEIEDEGDNRARAANFTQELVGAMTKLGDTLPPAVPGQVTITTMHGAKGLSAAVVVVMQAEDEVIPGDAVGPALDEARRLLYVSLTRAKKKLLVTACNRRTGNHRFVGSKEIVARSFTRFLRDYGLVAMTPDQYLAR